MIIGFVGPRGSGKDTAANILSDLVGGADKRAFGTRLKEVCEDLFGIPASTDGPDKEAPLRDFPRESSIVALRDADRRVLHRFTEHLGIEVDDELVEDFLDKRVLAGHYGPRFLTPRYAWQVLGTEVGRMLYADVWVEYALRDVSADRLVLVTDVRFPNEARAIRKREGKLIRCTYRQVDSEHASEVLQASIAVDWTLRSRTLDGLRGELVDIMESCGLTK